MTQIEYKGEYLQKCLRDYLNDQFEIEEALFMFSYLLKNQIADKLTNQFRETAQHLVEIDWISPDGKILVEIDEAQNEALLVQEEMKNEKRN